MATSAKNFTINKGFDNEFILTIKQNETFLPLTLSDTDTFKLYLINRDTDIVEFELEMDDQNQNGYISIHDKPNGKIKVMMKKAMTNVLEKERGSKEDRYYIKPTYKMLIDGSTTNNGIIVVKLNNVYVE